MVTDRFGAPRIFHTRTQSNFASGNKYLTFIKMMITFIIRRCTLESVFCTIQSVFCSAQRVLSFGRPHLPSLVDVACQPAVNYTGLVGNL